MKIRRKDVVEVAKDDPEYLHCGTCKHYQNLMICGNCCKLRRYSFDWEEYYRQNPEKFTGK